MLATSPFGTTRMEEGNTVAAPDHETHPITLSAPLLAEVLELAST